MKTALALPRQFAASPLIIVQADSAEKPPPQLVAGAPKTELSSPVKKVNAMDKPENWDEAWFGNYE